MGRGRQQATATATPARRGSAPSDAAFVTVQDGQRRVLADRKEDWQELGARLFALGGEKVVVPRMPDEDLDGLLADGQAFTGRATMMVGDPSQCHANTAGLWEEGRGRICTGYALSDDGYWRQHSWLRAHDGGLVETTAERVAYFGIELDDDAAADFAFDNW